jgi:hypothetical protein
MIATACCKWPEQWLPHPGGKLQGGLQRSVNK